MVPAMWVDINHGVDDFRLGRGNSRPVQGRPWTAEPAASRGYEAGAAGVSAGGLAPAAGAAGFVASAAGLGAVLRACC